MSKTKNKEILDNIYKTNIIGLNKEAIKSLILKQEIAGQGVLCFFKAEGL